LVQASSPATPCPTSSPVVAGIGREAVSSERGEEANVLNLGQSVLAKRKSAFFFFELIYSIQIQL
jgi:hypothetical protein